MVATKLNVNQNVPLQQRRLMVHWEKWCQQVNGGDHSPWLTTGEGHNQQYCVYFWAPQYKREMELLKSVQQRVTEMEWTKMKGLENLEKLGGGCVTEH